MLISRNKKACKNIDVRVGRVKEIGGRYIKGSDVILSTFTRSASLLDDGDIVEAGVKFGQAILDAANKVYVWIFRIIINLP